MPTLYSDLEKAVEEAKELLERYRQSSTIVIAHERLEKYDTCKFRYEALTRQEYANRHSKVLQKAVATVTRNSVVMCDTLS